MARRGAQQQPRRGNSAARATADYSSWTPRRYSQVRPCPGVLQAPASPALRVAVLHASRQLRCHSTCSGTAIATTVGLARSLLASFPRSPERGEGTVGSRLKKRELPGERQTTDRHPQYHRHTARHAEGAPRRTRHLTRAVPDHHEPLLEIQSLEPDADLRATPGSRRASLPAARQVSEVRFSSCRLPWPPDPTHLPALLHHPEQQEDQEPHEEHGRRHRCVR